MRINYIRTILYLISLAATLPAWAEDSIAPAAPVEIVGTHGRFDFIKFDAARHRLLACHTENSSLDVIDATTSHLIKSIRTGHAQGVAVDDKKGRYFVSCSKPPKLVLIDSTKLEIIGEVALPGPADVMAYDPNSDRGFVCNDEKPELWVIDPRARAIATTVLMPGSGMEDLAINESSTELYQCLKDSNALVRVDLKTMKVAANWPTAPAEKPHGMAIVPGTDAVLVAGGNGKLVLMSQSSGRVLSSIDIAPRVDEIAYDPGLRRVYCASGTGMISVVSVDGEKLTSLPALPSSPGAHSVAVDPQTHTVWITFAKDGRPYVQRFVSK